MNRSKHERKYNKHERVGHHFAEKKSAKALIGTAFWLIFIMAVFGVVTASQTMGKHSKVLAITGNQVVVGASNFGQYFSWSANQSSIWKNAAVTNGTAQTGSYSYNSAAGTGIMTLTTATANQVGIAALSSYKIDMTQPFSISGNLNLGNLNGADGVSFGFYPGNVQEAGAKGADVGIGGLRGAFGWTGDTFKNTYTIPNNLPNSSTSADPSYTLGDGVNAGNNGTINSTGNDYTKLYGGDPSQLVGGGAIGGWSFANAFSKYDAPNSTASGNNGIIGPKTDYNDTDSPQQVISSYVNGSWVPFAISYSPGSGSLENQGTLTAQYGTSSSSSTTSVSYSSTNPATSGITSYSPPNYASFSPNGGTESFTYTTGRTTITGTYKTGTFLLFGIIPEGGTYYQIETGTTTTIAPYTWSIPITTLENLAGDVTSDNSGNSVYPNSLSFFMTGSTGGTTNLQQFEISNIAFTPAQGNVITHYIDSSGNPIAANQTVSGNVGTAYTAAGVLATGATGYSYVGLATSSNNSAGIVSQSTSGVYTANDINVYYVYSPNVTTVTYMDDTTGQTLATDHLTYPANANYTTSSRITNYDDSGYQLVSDSTSGLTNLFPNATNNYTVHMAHNYTSTLKSVSETINYRDNSSAANPKALLSGISPDSNMTYLTFDTVKDDVTSAVLVYEKAGQQNTAPTVTTSGTSAGQVLDPSWLSVAKTTSGWQGATGNQISFAAVSDPSLSGFASVSTDDPNQNSSSTTYATMVTAQQVDASMDNIVVNVYYDPTRIVETTVNITRKIDYVDANDETIMLDRSATQMATFHSFQIIDKMTNTVLGYDTNGDGIVDTTSQVWLADSNNGTTNTSISSPDESSKGYGLPSQSSIAAITDTPTTVTLSAPNNGIIIVALPDIKVSYPLGAGKITLPFTGGIGFAAALFVFGLSLFLIFVFKRYKMKRKQ